MDIEYQKKEVTWCLDRDGPRICLRAVSINDELQHLQISSESFSLDLKTTEAQEFLSILKNLARSNGPTITSDEISSDIVKEISDEIFDEKPTEIPTIISSQVIESEASTPSLDSKEILDVLQQAELSTDEEDDESPIISSPSPLPTESLESSPTPTLDTSEILDVLKQSEAQEEEEPMKIRRLGSLFGKEEQMTLTPSPDVSKKSDVFKRTNGELEDELTQLTDILIGKEEPKEETSEPLPIQIKAQKLIKGISNEENVKPTEVLSGRVETASFFQKIEEKSPLEQLLDEDTEEKKSDSAIPPSSTEEQSSEEDISIDNEVLETPKEIAPFTPDDLHSSSFISNFDSKNDENKQETSFHSSEDDTHQLEPATERSYMTEAERRKQIEKEREARKKRLWELTRGF
jgi:hypothetical protein